MPQGLKSFILPFFAAIFIVMLTMPAGPAFADSTPAAVIYPAGGTYSSAQSVTIGNIPSGDVAYYTTDGSNPETSGTIIYYSGAFTVSKSETVEAAVRGPSGWGSVTSATFDIESGSQAPVISPSGGSFTSAQSVTISGINGTAYYTTDGTDPETSSTRLAYTGAFTVSQSETVQAANDASTGWSSVTSATFDIESGSQAPVISPSGGSFTSAQSVTISGINGTAYYTTDGTDPETSSTRLAYTGPFTVSQSETVQAANDASTGWSSITAGSFTIGSASTGVTLLSAPTVQTGVAASIAGNYATLNGDITSNGGDTINGYGFYYSTDQNQWSEVTAGTDNHYGSFSYNLTGLTTNTNYYFKAYATNPEGTVYGSVVSFTTTGQATQTVQSTTSGGPVINPAGGTYASAQSVTISNIPSGDVAYYTTDGSNPETSSTAVAYSAAFNVSQSETVQAAVHDPTSGWSSVTVASFTISVQAPVQSGSGSSSDQIDQLQQEFTTAISYNQITQATQILQQIQQLEKAQETITNLEEQFTAAYSSSNWGSAETILKTIISIENPGWAYSQLGQIYQQQGAGSISVFVNGNEVTFDVQPVIVNGRVLVPIRQIANALNLPSNDVTWNADGSVVINDGSNQIKIANNDQQVMLNGNAYSLDTPAQIIDGRMMVPLRAISQLLNKNVQWYPTGQIVEIS
jgi:hypothetical protein